MPVNQMTELRRQLRGAKAEYCVIKNTLAVRVSAGTSLADAKPHFKGPTGLVIGYDDPVLPAKILRDFIQAEKRSEKIKVTVGVLEGRLVQAADLNAIAQLPKKEVLIAMLLSAMQGPIRGVVYLAQYRASSCESLQPFRIKRKGRATCQQQKEPSCHRMN